jgi:protein tyrosine phosphatase (PTP) superfamily phosphohydrolase (DUF442 family)
MATRRTQIVCYRPKPGRAEALHALCATHYARLYAQGLVTRRLPVLLTAGDGSVLEVCEWKSQTAIDAARELPEWGTLRRAYAELCDDVPLAALPEAAELFASFDSAPIALELPPFFKVYNHVQVNARISTSGAITGEVIDEMAKHGYSGVINLLPETNPHALAEERQLVCARALAYHHIPVEFAAPTPGDYAAFERVLDGFPQDQKVFVHCAANMRVSAFIAIYGTRRMGWSAARAAEQIAEVWQLNDVWRVFVDAQLSG